MKFKDFQAPVLFSSTFKALNLGEKIQVPVLSSTFKNAWKPRTPGSIRTGNGERHVTNLFCFSKHVTACLSLNERHGDSKTVRNLLINILHVFKYHTRI